MTRCDLAMRSGKIGEEVRHLGRDAVGAVGCRNRLGVLGARLLHHVEAMANIHRQERERRRHRLGKEARALAAAEDQQRQPSVRLRRVIGTPRRIDDGRSHRVAGETRLAGEVRRQVLGRRERRGDAGDALGEHLVGAAEHGVLLVQQRRDAAQLRRLDGREGRIAAEADDDLRLQLSQQLEGGDEPARQQPVRCAPWRSGDFEPSVADGRRCTLRAGKPVP